MSLSRLLLPSFTVVLTSDHGSTILRDFQRAQSQIPILGPHDDSLMDTIDMRTPTGYIVYKCEFAREKDTVTLFEEDVKADTKGSFWRRLNMFRNIKGLGRK